MPFLRSCSLFFFQESSWVALCQVITEYLKMAQQGPELFIMSCKLSDPLTKTSYVPRIIPSLRGTYLQETWHLKAPINWINEDWFIFYRFLLSVNHSYSLMVSSLWLVDRQGKKSPPVQIRQYQQEVTMTTPPRESLKDCGASSGLLCLQDEIPRDGGLLWLMSRDHMVWGLERKKLED